MQTRGMFTASARGRAADAEVAAQALRLRRWALALLSEVGPSHEMELEAVRAPAEAWNAFLAIERCALALRRNPAAARVLHALPEAARAVVESFHLGEMQRAMSAQMHLATLARLAQRRDVPVVVLKGGVAIAEGELVYVADVDVLVPDAEARGFGDTLLEGNAFQRGGVDHLDGRGGHHLAPRIAANAVQVEVHFAVRGMSAPDVLARAVPLQQPAGLLRPCPEDYLFHLVYHSVVHHPERMGRLRDLLLVARACEDNEICAAATERLRAGRAGRRGVALVAFAQQIRAGTALRDPFAAYATATYLTIAEAQRTGASKHELHLWSVYAMLHGRSEYFSEAAALAADHDGRVITPFGQGVARFAPILIRPLRFCRRLARIVAAAPAAVKVVRRADSVARMA